MLLLYKPLAFDEKTLHMFNLYRKVFHIACGFVIGQSISVLTNQVFIFASRLLFITSSKNNAINDNAL